MLFSCNTSCDEIEQDRGGWFNIGEAHQACNFARSFIEQGLIRQSEICIMSPFMAQVRLLRKIMRGKLHNLFEVNIGPLVAFQGLEKRLVIVCTTRTRSRFVEQDLLHGYGIINAAKRFNVALTRAKEGLIVIGNPETLALNDSNWRVFLSYCYRNGLWQNDGTNSTWQPQEAKGEVTPYLSQLECMMFLREDIGIDQDDLSHTSNRKSGWIDSDDQGNVDLWYGCRGSIKKRSRLLCFVLLSFARY